MLIESPFFRYGLYANSPYLKNGDSISIFFGTKANITNYTNVAYGVNGNNVKNTGLTFTPRHSPNALDSYSAYITISNDLNGNFTFSLNITSNLGRTETLTQDDVAMNQNSAGIQSFIIIDTRVPGIENLTIYSDNSRDDYAMAGDLLNITVTANEVLESASITILGDTYAITKDDLKFTENIFIDTIPPDIALMGNSIYTVYQNTNEVIPGATVTDGDPNYSGGYNVSMNDTLDTSILGLVVNYTYTANPDTAGNPGKSVNRTITVIEPPLITISNFFLYANSPYLKNGDSISIFFGTKANITNYTNVAYGVNGNNVKNTGLTFTPRHSPNALDSYKCNLIVTVASLSNDLNGNLVLFSLNHSIDTSNLGRNVEILDTG